MPFGRSYNQTRDDFASEREYNDYLEEVEDLSALSCVRFLAQHLPWPLTGSPSRRPCPQF